VAFFWSTRITSSLARKQQLRERQQQEPMRQEPMRQQQVRMREQQVQQQAREQRLVRELEQLLLFYRKQPRQRQR
jgi:hypothetical protein